MERRLSAILAADVVGYSRAMGEDEAGTLIALKRLRNELLAPSVGEHRGRIVKEMGDGFLVEFASVVDAVTCALEVQDKMAGLTPDAEPRRLQLRIGVNLGDVIVDGEDLYGDGVNVAARLEGLAEPGGICLSRAARDQVRDKLDLHFDDLGEVEVKNIRRPVRAFRVTRQGAKPAGTLRRGWPGHRRLAAAAAIVALLAAAAAVTLLTPWSSDIDAASLERMAYELPDKPSIAVLPFANLSESGEDAYFAEGIIEDLITDLSKVPSLFVIARNSSFAYAGKPVSIRQVAEELGVRYVLEGSVRRAGEQVRVNAQLVDALSGGHIWAERYDGTMTDAFVLQDQVTSAIVSALGMNLGGEAAVASAGTGNADAYDAFLKGWSRFMRQTPDDFAEAVKHLSAAVELDPGYGRAHAALAAVYSAVLDNNWSTGTSYWSNRLGMATDEVAAALRASLEPALKSPDALAYSVAAAADARAGRHAESVANAGKAIELDPNDPAGHVALASSLIYAGRPDEAVANLERAMRLDPKAPYEYLYWLGLAHFTVGRFEEAARLLSRAVEENPASDRSLIVLAAAHGHLGDPDLGRETMARADRIRAERQKRFVAPGWRPGIDFLLVGPYTVKDVDLWPFRRSADRDRLKQGLRLAGVPERGEDADVSPLDIAGAVTVDAAAAKALYDQGALFVDVRTKPVWDTGHIPGTVHLDFKSDFTQASLSAVAEPDQDIVIYCMGPRCLLSSQACAAAVSWGFARVHYFREGFPAWKAAGYPVETVSK